MDILKLVFATVALLVGGLSASPQIDRASAHLDESIYIQDDVGHWVRYMRETSQSGLRHMSAVPRSSAYLHAYEQPAANEEQDAQRY